MRGWVWVWGKLILLIRAFESLLYRNKTAFSRRWDIASYLFTTSFLKSHKAFTSHVPISLTTNFTSNKHLTFLVKFSTVRFCPEEWQGCYVVGLRKTFKKSQFQSSHAWINLVEEEKQADSLLCVLSDGAAGAEGRKSSLESPGTEVTRGCGS